MDILYWNSLNPEIKFHDTTKQYFSKYLWRMVIWVPGGRLTNRPGNWTFEQAYNVRKNTEYRYKIFNLHRHQDVPVSHFDQVFLRHLEEVRNSYSDVVRIRVEEPYMQFYAETEDMLKNIAQSMNRPNAIRDITGPESDRAAKILKTGAILTRGDNQYKYKIILRDGMYSADTKQQLLNYLDSLGEEVYMTPGCKRMLTKPYPSIWGVYLYAQDENLATLIRLIYPTMVSNIHELVRAQ